MSFLLSASSSGFLEKFSSFFSFAASAFENFRINDAVDIFLLTCLFTIALRFLKNRKAGALIVGACILLVFFVLASVFNLSGIRFILSGLFQVGVLSVVIIFQPEIREILEKLGSGSLRSISNLADRNQKHQLQYNVVDNVCKAVQILSVEKTGALIVIERTTQLDQIIGSGVKLNAEVTDSLLRNIFYNRAPLHDGAIVIEDGKIAAASCILPLPQRTTVDSDLGTRHRAAIGLSEISDAIIIVVSEETGVISIAHENELIRYYTAEKLRKFLRQELLHDSNREDDAKKN